MRLLKDISSRSVTSRQDMAARIFGGMADGDCSANVAYGQLCNMVIQLMGAEERPTDVDLPSYEFNAPNSAQLVHRSPKRVEGFLGAIARSPQANTIIDAGTGSSALLAIGAALSHPGSEVLAYEVNGPAARCAREMIILMGLEDRITVIQGNVLQETLPEVDLGLFHNQSPHNLSGLSYYGYDKNIHPTNTI